MVAVGRISQLLLVGLVVAFTPRAAHGYWLQLARRELVREADFIAVVEIARTSTTRTRDRTWAYRQRAKARVLHPIKGRLPATISIYAHEDFICSRGNYQVGRRYLVFLSERDFLTTLNQEGGQFPISIDGELTWLPVDTWHDGRRMKLPDVLAEVRLLMAREASSGPRASAGSPATAAAPRP
jgi:hypothetical protein